jgi:hypothetical protein
MYNDTNSYQQPKLRLDQFKRVATASKHLPDWVQFLILSLLYWLEEWYIKQDITDTVSQAITEYQLDTDTVTDTNWKEDAVITITENPDSISQLPTLEIRVPYRTD